jgi:hypothetical protein
MLKDFADKKDLILKKIVELKKQNRNIEEIYKYTNDIIVEEEDEEEEDLSDSEVRKESDTHRSKSMMTHLPRNDSIKRNNKQVVHLGSKLNKSVIQ